MASARAAGESRYTLIAMPAPADPIEGYVPAIGVYEAWLTRVADGDAETREELLAAHDDLREILAGMVLDASDDASALPQTLAMSMERSTGPQTRKSR